MPCAALRERQFRRSLLAERLLERVDLRTRWISGNDAVRAVHVLVPHRKGVVVCRLRDILCRDNDRVPFFAERSTVDDLEVDVGCLDGDGLRVKVENYRLQCFVDLFWYRVRLGNHDLLGWRAAESPIHAGRPVLPRKVGLVAPITMELRDRDQRSV